MNKRPMFVGPVGCGKTSIIQRLTDQDFKYNKTQSVEFVKNFIDTPGEYIEHRRMYSYIATTAMDASVIMMILGLDEQRLIFPQGFTTMFACPAVGIVNKIDLENNDTDSARYKRVAGQLKEAGVQHVIPMSAKENLNVDLVAEEIKRTIS